MYTIEMAYARMRELQDEAKRSRAHQPTAAAARRTGMMFRTARAKKR
ncbi:hypothetical protein AB0I22_23915 [Streptomyces sp. NPDC050610]